jgi:putative metallohydrolase (TIGR04338 family)
MNCSCQQDEVYAAENDVTPGRRILSQEALQQFVDDLRDTDYWQRNFPDVRSILAICDPRRKARGSLGRWNGDGDGEILMSPVHMYERIVLHEVTHVIACARYGSHAHDPWFARTYLELVYAIMGGDVYAELKAAFITGGVDHDTDNAVPGGIAL